VTMQCDVCVISFVAAINEHYSQSNVRNYKEWMWKYAYNIGIHHSVLIVLEAAWIHVSSLLELP